MDTEWTVREEEPPQWAVREPVPENEDSPPAAEDQGAAADQSKEEDPQPDVGDPEPKSSNSPLRAP